MTDCHTGVQYKLTGPVIWIFCRILFSDHLRHFSQKFICIRLGIIRWGVDPRLYGLRWGTISVPVLVILFGPVVAIGIITPVYILGAATILPSAIKNVDWTEVLPVSIAGSIAVFLGLSFLITADPIVVKKIMGFFILFTTGIMILGKKYTGPRNILASAVAGIFTGGISGGTGIPGAPIMVMYYLAAKTAPAIQRANILTTGSIFSFCIIVGLGTNNIYSPTLILTVLMLSCLYDRSAFRTVPI